ncbi:MAG TPA: hypothetical protein DDW72_10610, partial [Afipia sp.]|nr:hypothetical protein [Afipia sp.]
LRPPHPLARPFAAPVPDRTLPRTFVQSSLRAEFFTDDYLAGVSGLGSLVKAAVAIGRGRQLTERLSEWDEAIVLATMSAGAHLIAGHLDTT